MAKLKRKVEKTVVENFDLYSIDGPVKDLVDYLRKFNRKNFVIETEWGYDGLEWANIVKVVKESDKDYEARCLKHAIDNADKIKARQEAAEAKKLAKEAAIEIVLKCVLAVAFHLHTVVKKKAPTFRWSFEKI